MSTRSNIKIKNGRTEILFYRHYDGYLIETGQDLHDDLSNSYFDNVGQYFNIAKFTEKLLSQNSSYRIINELAGDIEYLYTFEFEDVYIHSDHYNRVKLKSIEVDQSMYGGGGKNKYKSLSKFQDAINKTKIRSKQ